jgi:hypothetical protein
MEYSKILEEKAKQGFERFINFIRSDNNLLYETDESENGETEVEVSIFDDDECSDLIGYYNFDNEGRFLGGN